jgi:FAD/FMN-containing dehydrogenase
MTHTLFITQLADIFAAHQIKTNDAARPYHTDERNRYHLAPLAVVLPHSTAQISRLIKLCAAQNPPVAVIAQGGNTGLVGGCAVLPDCPSILLNLSQLNRVIEIDPLNQTATVDAGVTLQALHDALKPYQLIFPLTLASQNAATIGGNLATNAGGTQVLRYGSMRDLCLGLEVVLADGSVWDGLNTLRKNNTGYDLKHVFIGAEGTLGVITRAVLKLFPAPLHRVCALVACNDLKSILDTFSTIKSKFDQQLTAFEYISANAFDLVCTQFDITPPLEAAPEYALIELASSLPLDNGAFETALDTLLHVNVLQNAAIAHNEQQSAQFWRIRELISAAQKKLGKNIKHDISLPISSINAFCNATYAALQQAYPMIEPTVFGHIGDGNLHFNVSRGGAFADADGLMACEPQINAIVYRFVAQFHGSISAEHGIGLLKRDLLPTVKSDVELRLMRDIKQQFDPQNIMNPHKILP